MAITLTVGKNSFGLLSEADEYLAGSRRAAAAWLGVAPDDKRRALISAYRQIALERFKGVRADVEIVGSVAVANGGTGYAKGDILTVAGGDYGEPALVQVATVDAGVVTAVALLHAGTYSTPPDSPAATTGGAGSSCTLTLVYASQASPFPRSGLVDAEGAALDELLYPQALKEAQFELAFEINADPDIELSQGSASNLKAVGAGSARIEYFRAQENTRRFPVPVQALLAPFLAGGAVSAGVRGGANGVSTFECWPAGYGLTEGY